MKDNTRIATGAAVTILGALIALAPRFGFLRVCEYAGKLGMNGQHMHCYYTARAALVIGILTAIIGVVIMLTKNPLIQAISAAALGGAAIATILNPVVLYPICPNPDMPCNLGIKPLMIVIGIVIVGLAIWLGASLRSDNKTSV
ncbi:MAG: DUF4418 family protein [Thermoleophilia bacterium]|jgi:hypothetical protein